jgi:hypothetical protein
VKITDNITSKLFQVGTVNYSSGVVSLTNLRVDAISSPYLKVYAAALSKDLISSGNVILQIDVADISVAAKALRE